MSSRGDRYVVRQLFPPVTPKLPRINPTATRTPPWTQEHIYNLRGTMLPRSTGTRSTHSFQRVTGFVIEGNCRVRQSRRMVSALARHLSTDLSKNARLVEMAEMDREGFERAETTWSSSYDTNRDNGSSGYSCPVAVLEN